MYKYSCKIPGIIVGGIPGGTRGKSRLRIAEGIFYRNRSGCEQNLFLKVSQEKPLVVMHNLQI